MTNPSLPQQAEPQKPQERHVERHTPRGPGEKWTYDDRVSQEWTFSGEMLDLIDNIKNGKMAPFGGAHASKEDQKILADVQHFAKNMGVEKRVVMYVDTTDRGKMPSVSTAEVLGREVVIVNDAALNRFSTKQLESVLAHETSHLAHNDSSLGSAIVDFFTPGGEKKRETRADQEASGPLGTCDPRSLAEALQIGLDINYEIYRKRYPDISKEDFVKQYETFDTEHAAITERIQSLNAAAEHPAGACVVPPGTPNLPAERTDPNKTR